MSGGHFDYNEQSLAHSLFGWCLDVDYGEDGFKQSILARKLNPMGNREISELVWDMLCLIHSRDYYESGDTGEDTYNKDLAYFKNKWLKRTDKDVLNAYKEDLKLYADELIEEFGKGCVADNEYNE